MKQLSQNPQLKKRITVVDGHSHTVLQNGQVLTMMHYNQVQHFEYRVRLHLITAMERYQIFKPCN
ncbi:hypothetical protein ACVPOR_13835 [Staphylococcus aureus]